VRNDEWQVVLVLSEAVLVIETDAKNCIHGLSMTGDTLVTSELRINEV
jgi:hypothetical protein